jgi:hypothetical protein
VLGQQYLVRLNTRPRAQSTVDGWINTYNHLNRNVAAWSYDDRRSQIGVNIDWIFATNWLVVQQWEDGRRLRPVTLLVRGVSRRTTTWYGRH